MAGLIGKVKQRHRESIPGSRYFDDDEDGDFDQYDRKAEEEKTVSKLKEREARRRQLEREQAALEMDDGDDMDIDFSDVGDEMSSQPTRPHQAAGSVEDAFGSFRRLEVVRKLIARDYASISLKEVKQMFQELSINESLKPLQASRHDEEGSILVRMSLLERVLTTGIVLDNPLSKDELHDLFKNVYSSVDAKGKDPEIASELFHFCLTTAVPTTATVKPKENSAGGAASDNEKTTRDDLLNMLLFEQKKRDDFSALPLTLFYIIIFVVIVNEHLSIYSRQLMEESLEEWLNGLDPRSRASDNVDDMATFWEWALEVAIPGVLGAQNEGPSGLQYMMASRHSLIGDIKMFAESFDGSEKEAWILHSSEAQGVLAGDSNGHLAAATAAATKLMETGWNSTQIQKIGMSFITYNEFAKAIAFTSGIAFLSETGKTRTVMNADAFFLNAYTGQGKELLYGIDLLVVLLVIRMVAMEFIQIRRLGDLRDYWTVWNFMDWCNIINSFIAIIMWCLCLSGMSDDIFTVFLSEDYKIRTQLMDIPQTDIARLEDTVQGLRTAFRVLHASLAFMTFFICVKFFRAFQSNRRLKVVTDTFREAATDLAHFFIIFLTLFLPFTIIGHILFGNDVPEMGSVMASIDTGVQLLMGEFGWYSEIGLEHIGSTLPSGMPTVVLFIWFFLFNFMMVLVVLNMLLAVVLEHYTKITGQLVSEPDAPPIWTQVRQYIGKQAKERRFLTVRHILRLLEHPDHPVHPQMTVNEESLKRAFTGMKHEQAQYLMEFLRTERDYERQRELHKEVHTNHQPEILDTVRENGLKLRELGDKVRDPDPHLMLKVEQLLRSVRNVREDQLSLRREMDKLTAKLPEEISHRLKDLGVNGSNNGTASSVRARSERPRRPPS